MLSRMIDNISYYNLNNRDMLREVIVLWQPLITMTNDNTNE